MHYQDEPRNYSVTSEEEVEKTEFVNFGGYNGASTETTFGVGKIPSGKFVAHKGASLTLKLPVQKRHGTS